MILEEKKNEILIYSNLPSFCNFRRRKLFKCILTSAEAFAPKK